MSHLEKILDETFGKKKPKQVEVAVERLHPPMAPIASEKTVEVWSPLIKGASESRSLKTDRTLSDSKLAIDFNRIANLSTFQRFIIEAIKISVPGFKGVPTRGKKKMMATEFNRRVADYKDVMKELKLKIEGRKDE